MIDNHSGLSLEPFLDLGHISEVLISFQLSIGFPQLAMQVMKGWRTCVKRGSAPLGVFLGLCIRL